MGDLANTSPAWSLTADSAESGTAFLNLSYLITTFLHMIEGVLGKDSKRRRADTVTPLDFLFNLNLSLYTLHMKIY